MATNTSGTVVVDAKGAQPNYAKFSKAILGEFEAKYHVSGNAAGNVDVSAIPGGMSMEIHVTQDDAGKAAGIELEGAIRALGDGLRELSDMTHGSLESSKAFAGWAEQLQSLMNQSDRHYDKTSGRAAAQDAVENLIASLAEEGRGSFGDTIQRRLAASYEQAKIDHMPKDAAWEKKAGDLIRMAEATDRMYAQRMDTLAAQKAATGMSKQDYEKQSGEILSSYANGVEQISKNVTDFLRHGIQTRLPGTESKQTKVENDRRETSKTKTEEKAAKETAETQRAQRDALKEQAQQTKKEERAATKEQRAKNAPAGNGPDADEALLQRMTAGDRRQYERIAGMSNASDIYKKLAEQLKEKYRAPEQEAKESATAAQPQTAKNIDVTAKNTNITSEKAPEMSGGSGKSEKPVDYTRGAAKEEFLKDVAQMTQGSSGGGPGGGGGKAPTGGAGGGSGTPPVVPPTGGSGSTPPADRNTVRYFDNLTELNKSLREDYKLGGIADDIVKQLGSLKSSASDISATFDGKGNLSGISLNAKSVALGDVKTARLQYGVTGSPEEGYAWSGAASRTLASPQKLKDLQKALNSDTAAQQERLNTWLKHDALALNADGRNTMRERLLDNISDYVYQNAKGQTKLGHKDAATGKVTNLTRDELKGLTDNLDTFDQRMSAINKGMRQDLVSRGIDDIQGKFDKRVGMVAGLKDRLNAIGINPNDAKAVFGNGESVKKLFGDINKATQSFQKHTGNIEAQVEDYNKLHDLTRRAQQAVQQEESQSRAAVSGAQRSARIQSRKDAANRALGMSGAEQNAKQAENLRQAMTQLDKAKTPAETVAALANVKKYTDDLTRSTKEYGKQADKAEATQTRMANADKQITDMGAKLKAAGLDKPQSLKDAEAASRYYGSSKDAAKQQGWADKTLEHLGTANTEVSKALKQFESSSKKAESQYQRMMKNDLLGSGDRKAIEKAYGDYSAKQNQSTLEKLQTAMNTATSNIAASDKSNKTEELRARVASKRGDLETSSRRAGGRDSGKWSKEQVTLAKAASDNLTAAEQALSDGGIKNARSYLSRATTQIGQLNKQLGETERVANEAAAAQKQNDAQTEAAQTRAERNAFYGNVNEAARDRMDLAKATYAATGDAKDLKKYQNEVNNVQWAEKVEQMKAYQEQLGLLMNPTGTPGRNDSANWAVAQQQQLQNLMNLQQQFQSIRHNGRDQSAADTVLGQMRAETQQLMHDLNATEKIQQAMAKTTGGKNYSRVDQDLRDNLNQAMSAMMSAAPDQFAAKMNAVQEALKAVNTSMQAIGAQDYWAQQSAALDQYQAKLNSMNQRNGGMDSWTESQRSTSAGIQRNLDAARAAMSAKDMGAYQAAMGRVQGNSRLLDTSLTNISRLAGGAKPPVDALTRSLMNIAAPMMLWRRFTGYMKKAAQNVAAIDSQMADLKKVTSNTSAEYDQFLTSTGKNAVAIGSSISDLVATTSTFAHMGYGLTESQALGVTATKFANVGGFKNTTDAADTMIAAIKGFNDLEIGDADIVGDKLTAVANNYAVTVEDISNGLQKSASALNVAGNNIDQSTAMITAIAEVTRDAGAAGSALKVLSMRIRGAKAELEESGESTENMASSTAKLRAEVAGLTNVDGKGGVDIMADEETFKSTYEIMKEISQVWGKMSDINRSALLEKLAGKVRSNQVAALLENFDQAEKALETSQGAEGTMNRVHQRWLDSVEARQAQFNASVEAASMTAMPANTLKGLYQAGTTGMNMLNNLMGNVFGLGVGAGSGGVGAGVLGVASLLRSGNGNIWAGIGNAFNRHKGGRGQADIIAAYNRAYQDATNPLTYNNKEASLAAAQVNGRTANKYTQRLIEQAEGTVDATKATGGLISSLKSFTKNAIGGIATFAAINTGVALLNASMDWLSENVVNRSEHLDAVASSSYAQYEETKRNADAVLAERDQVSQQVQDLGKKQAEGTITTQETSRLAQLESQLRELEHQAAVTRQQQVAESDQSFTDWMAARASRGQNVMGTSAMYKTLGAMLGNGGFDSVGDAVTSVLGSVWESTSGWATGLWTGINPTHSMQTLYREEADNAGAIRNRADRLLQTYGGNKGNLTPEGARAIANMYQNMLGFQKMAEGFDETKMSTAEVMQGYRFAQQQYQAIEAQMKESAAAYGNTMYEALSGEKAFQDIFSNWANIQMRATNAMYGAEQETRQYFPMYADLVRNGLNSPAYNTVMANAIRESLAMREMLAGEGEDASLQKFDFLNSLLRAAGFEDAMDSMHDMASKGQDAASITDQITNKFGALGTLLEGLRIPIGYLANLTVASVEAAKQAPDETAGGGAVANTLESSKDNINALLSAQQAAAKIWKDSGFTGALDTTSKDFTELMAMDGGAYQAALERANGGLFFSKDAFDKIVQQKYREELAALRQDVLKTQQKYTEAATKVVEEMKSGTVSQESYEAMLGYGTQLTKYANRMAQINYGMSDMANWISNKGGAESGDAYDELGEAINAITGGKSSGLTGTREFAAAMRFVTGKEIGSGAGQVLLGDLSSKTMSYMQALGAVDKNGKPDQAARRNALAAFQKDMKAAGILDKTGAVAVAGMTTGQMADKFNEKYGTQFGADFMQSILMGINDYIQDPAEKYDISTETPESKRAEEARKNFQDAVKAWREAPEDLEDAQKQALLDGVVEAGEAMTKAQLQDLVANGSTEQAAAASAALANMDKQETADPLTAVLGKLDATLSALNTTLSKENKDEEGGKKGKGADEYQDTKEVPDKPAFTSGKSTFASAEAEATSLTGLTQEIKDYESKHGGSDALTELIGEAENEGASYDTILEKWNNYRSNVEEAEQQAVQQAAEEAKSSKWSFGKLADQYDDTKTIRDKPKRTFTTGPSTFQDAEEAGKALADLGEQAKALEKQYGSSDALTELIGEIETEGADYDTMLNKLNNVRSDLEEAAANATEAEAETATSQQAAEAQSKEDQRNRLLEAAIPDAVAAIEDQQSQVKARNDAEDKARKALAEATENALRETNAQRYGEAYDKAMTSPNIDHGGPGKKALDQAFKQIGAAFEAGDWEAFEAAMENLDQVTAAVAAADQERREREQQESDDRAAGEALQARLEEQKQTAEPPTVSTDLDKPLTEETAVSAAEETTATLAELAQADQERVAAEQEQSNLLSQNVQGQEDLTEAVQDNQPPEQPAVSTDFDTPLTAETGVSAAEAKAMEQALLAQEEAARQQMESAQELSEAVQDNTEQVAANTAATEQTTETSSQAQRAKDAADLDRQEREERAKSDAAAGQTLKDRREEQQKAQQAQHDRLLEAAMPDAVAAISDQIDQVNKRGEAEDKARQVLAEEAAKAAQQPAVSTDFDTPLTTETGVSATESKAMEQALKAQAEAERQQTGGTQPEAVEMAVSGKDAVNVDADSVSVAAPETTAAGSPAAPQTTKETTAMTGPGFQGRKVNVTGVAKPVSSGDSRSLDQLYERARQLSDVFNEYIDQNGAEGEKYLNVGRKLDNAITNGDDANIGAIVSEAEAAAAQAGITIPVDVEPTPPIDPPEEPTVTIHTNVEDPGSISVPTPPTVTIPVQYGDPGEIPTGGGGGGKDAVRTVSAAAGGTDDAAGGMTLVDELGAELIEHRSRGTYELGTNNGARFVKLDAGDVVHNAKETRKILKRGMAMANGGVVTGRAMSSISNGKDMTGGSDQAAAIAKAQRDAAAAQEAAAAALNSSDRKAKALLEWIKKVLDWIPTYLNELKKKTTQFVGAADDAVHYLSQNKLLDSAIENIAEEIQANISSVVRYRSFLREMQTTGGLSDEIVAKIQNGTIDLEAYNNEETVKAIQAYQQYWEKLVACQEALATLNDQMEALSQQKLDNVVSYFDRIDGLLRDQQKRFEGLIDLKKQYGQELTGADYMDSLTNMEQILANAQNEEQALLKELEDQLGVGGDMVQAILNGGKDVWEAIAAHVKKGVDEGVTDLQEAIDENLVYRTVAHYNTGIGTEKLGSMTDIAATPATPEVTQLSLADVQKIATGAMNINLDQVPAAQRAAVQAAIKGTTSTFSNATNKNAQAQAILDKIQAQQQQYSSKQVNQQALPPVEISLVDVPVTPATDEDMIAIGEMLGMNVADGSEEALRNLEAIKSLFTTSWDNPLAIGSDTWYSYMSTLENLKESITQTKIEISEMNDTIADIPLTNLKTGYDYLEEIQRNLEGMNSLLDAQGSDKYAETYRSLISVGMQQIENLQEQNRLIEEQMSTLDPLSEKYQELRGDLTGNLDTIADIRKNQEEWNDAIIDLQIERLKKQNDSYKEQLRLMQALDDLDKARQRRLLIYHEDTGFRYEADEDELENAQEAANDAIFSSIVSDLEKSKADSNIYGPLGERLISGSSILDSLGNVLVPVEDKLSGLDFEPYYQSIVSGSEQSGLLEGLLQSIDLSKLLEASIGGNVNIDIGTMTLNEVQNAKDLGDAIINQLPSYLLQALYKKGAN